jgi:hypothetical protein
VIAYWETFPPMGSLPIVKHKFKLHILGCSPSMGALSIVKHEAKVIMNLQISKGIGVNVFYGLCIGVRLFPLLRRRHDILPLV